LISIFKEFLDSRIANFSAKLNRLTKEHKVDIKKEIDDLKKDIEDNHAEKIEELVESVAKLKEKASS